MNILWFILYVVVYLLIILFVIFMEQAVRKIPIQYSNSSYSVRSASDVTYLPIKLNSAGVIPIIFSSSVMAAPATIVALVGGSTENNGFVQFLSLTDTFHGWYTGLIVFAALNLLFTFFYANMQVDSQKMSENFSKSGAYIPGVRPGKETQKYISRVLNRITSVGALFITSIALIPYVMQIIIGLVQTKQIAASLASGFGGTGIIIVVGVALETVKEIEGRMAGKDYSGFAETPY